jgi:hypothetical protein
MGTPPHPPPNPHDPNPFPPAPTSSGVEAPSVTHLQLRRTRLGNEATIGELRINGYFECFTLEDKVREVLGQPTAQWKIQGVTAIPVGTYQVIVDMSSRFGRLMPHILDVPGFSGIRIHRGNTDKDTEGCVLLGTTVVGEDLIAHSTEAFTAFFNKLQTATKNGVVYITITQGD